MQGMTEGPFPTYSLSQWRDLLAGLFFACLMISVHVLAYIRAKNGLQSLCMGVAGYLGVAGFSFSLLVLVRGEVIVEQQQLPDIFKTAYWTYSDCCHTEHRPTKGPMSNVLTTARLKNTSQELEVKKHRLAAFLIIGLIGSYATFYLNVRVSPWWVSFSSLCIIWVGALYRATTSQSFLTATSESVEASEHWIGLFRNNLGESLQATLAGAAPRSANVPHTRAGMSSSTNCSPTSSTNTQDRLKSQTSLFVIPAARSSLKTWSGAEDVMKVGLEMAKMACHSKTIDEELVNSAIIQSTCWIRVVRFHMHLYVPGLIWSNNQTIDFTMGSGFDFHDLFRLLMKLLHVCMDHQGTLTTHPTGDPETVVKLSHVLCGPIAVPPIANDFAASPVSLRTVLTSLRDTPSNAATRKFTLEQALLLPTIMLLMMYDRWHSSTEFHGEAIGVVQSRFADGLALSGKEHLKTMEAEFTRLNLWSKFTTDLREPRPQLQVRSPMAGDYA